MRHEDDLRRAIATRLADFPGQALAPPEEARRVAAVAVVAVPMDDGDAGIILTRRPDDAPRHPGQYALPGGRVEGRETFEEAARRELEEEVGLSLPASAVLGRLDDFATRSGWRITPVVMWCDHEPELRPDPGEVAAIHEVALGTLAGDIVHEWPSDDPARPILSLALLGIRIFAPTAAMILQFRERCLMGRNTRVAHYEQPRFAWR